MARIYIPDQHVIRLLREVNVLYRLGIDPEMTTAKQRRQASSLLACDNAQGALEILIGTKMDPEPEHVVSARLAALRRNSQKDPWCYNFMQYP